MHGLGGFGYGDVTRESRADPVGGFSSLVSVIIPCYNAERWIADAIRSALEQTHSRVEVVVVDDGSTDKSSAIIRSFGTAVVYESSPHRGGNSARNTGFRISSGAYIQWLDADDVLVREKLARQVAFLEAHPECDVVYGDWRHRFHPADGPAYDGPLVVAGAQTDVLAALLGGWWNNPAAYLVRRRSAMAGGGWDERLRAAQDFDYWVGLALAGCAFCYQPGVASIYRKHIGPTVSRNTRAWLEGNTLAANKVRGELEARRRLSPAYRQLLAVLHLRLARSYFDLDRIEYDRSLRAALELDPHVARSGPRWYRAAVPVLGYTGAEYLARVKRRMARVVGGAPPKAW